VTVRMMMAVERYKQVGREDGPGSDCVKNGSLRGKEAWGTA
jgi:hypothetical protein